MKSWHIELLKLFAFDWTDSLWWEEVDGQLVFSVVCDDTFYPSTTEKEEIKPDDLADLQQARADLPVYDWPLLWVARKRKLRPLVDFLEECENGERQLFEQAGPPR